MLLFINSTLFLERNPLAVPVGEFADHVAKLHADSDYLFSEEFHVSLPDLFLLTYRSIVILSRIMVHLVFSS